MAIPAATGHVTNVNKVIDSDWDGEFDRKNISTRC